MDRPSTGQTVDVVRCSLVEAGKLRQCGVEINHTSGRFAYGTGRGDERCENNQRDPNTAFIKSGFAGSQRFVAGNAAFAAIV